MNLLHCKFTNNGIRMARKKRIWYPGASYHVMSRGNRRADIFRDHGDYIFFLECIAKVKEKYPFTIHSLCLMTNHFHMSVETGDVELWKIMQKLLSIYAEEFNHKYSYKGHLFESRYSSCIIEDERYFLEVSRYIHLNPVKAQMVQDPLAYKYSSYGLFLGNIAGKKQNRRTKCGKLIRELTDTSRVLSFFQDNVNEQYRMFVEGKISHEEQELIIQKEMKENDLWLPW